MFIESIIDVKKRQLYFHETPKLLPFRKNPEPMYLLVESPKSWMSHIRLVKQKGYKDFKRMKTPFMIYWYSTKTS